MTPIDPSDRLAVTLAYNDGMQTAYEAGEKELPGLRYEGIYAVARAVLPEGYVAVPVAELEEILNRIVDVWGRDGAFEQWQPGVDVIDALRSLLPTEESAGDA